ncbi:hypothetical protein N5U22_10595 [Aliarcobacter cryaerophilus]|uniref:hypothetical protein n=1 Tax=Aliarcobacter cryaerophilus TaxID=28198 RepID=UPI0021B5404E|nr:hypothetical protein [Aliarcobacter cryaerophilus]MCT7533863.1 hypothetical protein [Aliarcobacter cryaerophilus]
MSKYKKLSFIWLLSILAVVSFHAVIYFTYMQKVFPKSPYTIGDLARMSYAADLVDLRENRIDLNKKHIEEKDYLNEKIDFLTLGDSFSNGGGGGLNTYYQDYIATTYDKNVLNIAHFKDAKNYIETVSRFLNSGELEKMGVKYVLIESVQRFAMQRFSINQLDFSNNDITIFKNKIENNFKNTELKKRLEHTINDDIGIINNLNLNALIYNLRFKIKGYGKINSDIYREKMDKNLFSTGISDEILFFHEDLDHLKFETKENIELLNKNFNILANLLSQKNIKLIFMPAVDKYNLYSPYIISNSYAKSMFFEYLDTLQKDYIFINSKKILSEYLEKGEKDIFYVDDTHWSYKASNILINNESFKKIFD